MMRNKAKSLNIAVIMKSKVMGSKGVRRIDKTTLKQAMMRASKHNTQSIEVILQSMC